MTEEKKSFDNRWMNNFHVIIEHVFLTPTSLIIILMVLHKSMFDHFIHFLLKVVAISYILRRMHLLLWRHNFLAILP